MWLKPWIDSEQIVSYRDSSQVSLETLHDSVAQLEALESTMDAMLELHRGVQVCALYIIVRFVLIV
jgi:hypothetical protein